MWHCALFNHFHYTLFPLQPIFCLLNFHPLCPVLTCSLHSSFHPSILICTPLTSSPDTPSTPYLPLFSAVLHQLPWWLNCTYTPPHLCTTTISSSWWVLNIFVLWLQPHHRLLNRLGVKSFYLSESLLFIFTRYPYISLSCHPLSILASLFHAEAPSISSAWQAPNPYLVLMESKAPRDWP